MKQYLSQRLTIVEGLSVLVATCYYLWGWMLLDVLPNPYYIFKLELVQNDVIGLTTWILASYFSHTLILEGSYLFKKK